MEKVHITIEGMSCGHCVSRVRRALQEVAGVQVTTVEVGSAEVEIDSTRTTPEEVARAVAEVGFAARASATRAA